MTQVTIQGQNFYINNDNVGDLINWISEHDGVKTPTQDQVVDEIAKFEGKELING